MSVKNIRNTTQGIINITTSDPNDIIVTYNKSEAITVTYDPNSLLFASPEVSTLVCERIGDMIYIKINGFNKFPSAQSPLFSNASVIPTPFRPLTTQICPCIVINGYVPPGLPLFTKDEQFATFLGVAKLTPAGTLSFSPERPLNFGPIGLDGVTHTAFQGPNPCGLVKQTLCFSAD